jgi:3-methyladenine DNA glycosylase/8-oxoguanine DNA glycosylase
MIRIPTPRGFNFRRTALSHGWYDLLPFSYDMERHVLRRDMSLQHGPVVRCEMSGDPVSLTPVGSAMTRAREEELVAQVRICLRLDEDLTPFHREARRHPQYRWMARTGSGRLLRAPTVFEDVVKMMCTTNCTWGLTKQMVRNLVHCFGKRGGDELVGFPEPASIAGSGESFLRKHCSTGYRSPYILEFADRVAGGKLDPEQWRGSPLDTDALFREIHSVKGIGPYAAGNILKLLGRYDYLGLDSWVRARYFEIHRKGRKVKDSTIEKQYAEFGQWRGLFFWLEMTRGWHEDKFTSQTA